MVQKLFYACDYRGIDLKNQLIQENILLDVEFEDLGISSGSDLDYVDISKILSDKLREEPHALGVIICGSGQGVAIALNRSTHIRAVMCRTEEDALQTKEKLNANVISLGSKYTNLETAKKIIISFINGSFKEEKHARCVLKLATNQTDHIGDGVNLIARAIIIHNNHVLLSTATPENPNFPPNLFFLPGGHVEYNEPAITALEREIWEEMNLRIKNANFLSALECSWNRKEKIYHELDLVYSVDIDNLDISNPPVAMDHKFHMFVWKNIEELDVITILPEKLKIPIVSALRKNSKPVFQSSMIKEI